ncbi:MAG TPA: rhodanese-like domain-containing protein [Steroidobacteraceae bacterium]|nr:rhodanese-like domain-containing protein [Steroidobacteraceae bacterium]
MSELIAQYGLALVFANVLAERAGLPLPAMPTLVVAGALAAVGQLSAPAVFGVAVLACIIGDSLWYAAGVYYGRRVISLLCRISVSPDSCVRQTENRFAQWGRITLVFAKFVPGLSTVVRPLAGTIHLGWLPFEFFNGLGAVLWVGVSVGAGMIFHDEINTLLHWLRDFGIVAFTSVIVLASAFIAYKWWQRRRFNRMLNIARINAEELRRLMEGEPQPVVVDLRSQLTRDEDGRRIPGALIITLDHALKRVEQFPIDRDIVFYCNCPNEASAAYAARQLIKMGYTRVRPLLGGLDAWVSAGFDVEVWTPGAMSDEPAGVALTRRG